MADTAYGYQWAKLRVEAKRYYPARCHLCGGDIDMTLDRKHPQSWTLDHLYPVAIHGDACPDITEVKPAHRQCNERRGTQPLAPSPRSEDW